MLEYLPESVRIFEVAPRDGLQNEPIPISTEDKYQFIKLLCKAGINHLELSSFVRPDAIPQLNDAAELVPMVLQADWAQNVHFSCLVPNIKGMEKAIESGIKEVAVFTATSETFSQRNVNASITETFNRFQSVMKLAQSHDIKVRGYLSTVFGCPYEGNIPIEKTLELTQRLLDLGVYEVSLGDTIGVGTPVMVKQLIKKLFAACPADKLALHFHDTYRMALANTLTALDLGITAFDSSTGGIGGCPYAKGASGNVATEAMVYLLESLNIATGIDQQPLKMASQFIQQKLGKSANLTPEFPQPYLFRSKDD